MLHDVLYTHTPYCIVYTVETNQKPFVMMIKKSEWKKIQPTKSASKGSSRGYNYRMPLGKWTDVFNEAFMQACTQKMKGCTLKFDYHRVADDKGSKESKAHYYISCKARCNRKQEAEDMQCTMQYMMHIVDKPVKDAFIQVM